MCILYTKIYSFSVWLVFATLIQEIFTDHFRNPDNISSKFLSNSEAFASEFKKILKQCSLCTTCIVIDDVTTTISVHYMMLLWMMITQEKYMFCDISISVFHVKIVTMFSLCNI